VRLKKEPKPKFKAAGSKESRRLFTIDNRRGDRFAGYQHNISLMTADELWDELIAEVNFALLLPPKQPAANLGAAFNSAAYRTNVARPFFEKPLNIPSSTFMRNFMNVVEQTHQSDDRNRYRLEPGQGSVSRELQASLASILFTRNFTNADEQTRQFDDRNRYRFEPGQKTVSTEWIALQAGLKPSLADEDVLGTWDEWVANTPPGTQFILLGDTNHYNAVIHAWLENGKYMPALARQGFKDTVVEASTRRLRKKKALRAQAAGLGVTLHAFDEQLDLKRSQAMKTRHTNDTVLADGIKNTIGDRPAVVVYGAAHFAYIGGLHDQLGREKCRHINIHANLEDFHHSTYKPNAAFPAPYAYLIEEDTVVATFGNYQRDVKPSRDDYLKTIVIPNEQEKQIDLFKERYKDALARDPAIFGKVNPDDVIERIKLVEHHKRIYDTWQRTGRSGLIDLIGRRRFNP